MGLATVTKVGRSALIKALSERPLHLAWGVGDVAWDTDPSSKPSLINSEALIAEVGRRTVTQIAFVTPDPAGEIVLPTGTTPGGEVQESRYRIVVEPTPHLYVRAAYAFSDAANLSIREMGLFSDTVIAENTPPGQRYFVPAEVADTGFLIAAEILDSVMNRSPSIRQSIEFVFTL